MTCRHCDTPTAGASLCEKCAKTLMFAVANVAGHYADLGTATKGSIGKTQPLPVDMRFLSSGRRHCRECQQRWKREFEERRRAGVS